MRHAISWFEIPVTDRDRARQFYETILGVELHSMELANGLKMAIFPVEPGTIGGALCEHPDYYHPGQKGPLIYLNAAPNIQKVLDKVASVGGTILVPKTEISKEHGFMAVLQDTEGNRIALRAMQ